jgi:hypothetical protein
MTHDAFETWLKEELDLHQKLRDEHPLSIFYSVFYEVLWLVLRRYREQKSEH